MKRFQAEVVIEAMSQMKAGPVRVFLSGTEPQVRLGPSHVSESPRESYLERVGFNLGVGIPKTCELV